MFGKLDPEKVKKVQEVTSAVTAEIRTDWKAQSITFVFAATTPEAQKFVNDNILSSFPTMFATQLKSFFNIDGEFVTVNKPK